MLYVRVNCFVVHGCAVSRRYINVCNSDVFSNVFSVVNMYLDHLKFCVGCDCDACTVVCVACVYVDRV